MWATEPQGPAIQHILGTEMSLTDSAENDNLELWRDRLRHISKIVNRNVKRGAPRGTHTLWLSAPMCPR